MAPSDLPLSNWMSMCTLRLDLPLVQQLRIGRISTTFMASNGPFGLPTQEGVLRRAATRADKKINIDLWEAIVELVGSFHVL